MESVTIAEQIAEVEREIKIRESTYKRWVLNGKITARAAELQMGRMRAVVDTLKRAGVEFADRPPGALPTGEVFGPAKVREVERAKVLSALAELIDQRAYYALVAKLQATDKGVRK